VPNNKNTGNSQQNDKKKQHKSTRTIKPFTKIETLDKTIG
jgi:hypothetical protein